jgi:hypothetical protein
MRFYLLFVLLASAKILSAQNVTAIPVTVLPSQLMESSGLEKTGPNMFWSHNDSGNQPDIYGFDSSGTLIKIITVTNASNVDWEDLAQGDNGEFYIGDFGNNNNDRSAANNTALTIYIIPPPGGIVGTTTTAQSIVFEYEDRDLNAPYTNHNFDMEGFFFFNDSLHLFSKNRTNPANGWVKHYILPAEPGNYTAMLVDSFNNGGYMITSADIAPHKNTVALLSNNRIFLYTCFTGSKFLSTGHVTSIGVALTQKEAIVFSTDDRVYITDEYFSPTVGQTLYRAELSGFISPQLQIGSVAVDSICPGLQNGEISVIPEGGYQPYTYTWSSGDSGDIIDSLVADTYTVHITDSHGCFVDSTILVGGYTNLPAITATVTPTCPCDSAGIIETNIAGGVGPFQYAWGGDLTNDTLANLPAGDYPLIVTDGNGCLYDTTFTVPQYDTIRPVISLYEQYLVSNDSNIVYWSHDGFLLATVNDTIYVNGLWGYYTVTVLDSNGCHITSEVYDHYHIGLDNAAASPENIILSKTDNSYILNNTSNQNYTVQVYALDGRLIASIPINAGALQELTMPVEALHIFAISNGKTTRSLIK